MTETKTKIDIRAHLIWAFVVTVAIIASACAGTKARENVLMPTMALAYDSIAPDVALGAGDLLESGRLALALERGDRYLVAGIDWPPLHAAALRGIQMRLDAGDLSPPVAKSLRERVRNFDESMRRLLAR